MRWGGDAGLPMMCLGEVVALGELTGENKKSLGSSRRQPSRSNSGHHVPMPSCTHWLAVNSPVSALPAPFCWDSLCLTPP